MATIQPNTDYMIVNYNSGLVWAVQGDAPNVGQSVVQYSWVIDPNQYNQRWNFEQVAGGWQIRTSLQFGALYAAIDKNRAPTDNNAGVNVYPLSGLTSQVWALSSNQIGDWIAITNITTGKCCDVRGESGSSDAYIVQYDCIAQSGQRWMIIPYIPGMTP
jgi:hypothetical protein